MKLTKALATAALCCVLLALSCASTQPLATSKEAVVTPAQAPVVVQKPSPVPAGVQDYLGENIKLVGIGHDSGGPYTVRFYTAKVLTPPSAATKNGGLVKPTGKVADSSETEFWTPYIASSRPALKDELKPGMVVFAMGDASKRMFRGWLYELGLNPSLTQGGHQLFVTRHLGNTGKKRVYQRGVKASASFSCDYL